jgi:hypothetical protein
VRTGDGIWGLIGDWRSHGDYMKSKCTYLIAVVRKSQCLWIKENTSVIFNFNNNFNIYLHISNKHTVLKIHY